MKKATLKSLVAYLNGETVTNLSELKAELENELSKGEAKAQANRDAYAEAHDAVMAVMTSGLMTVQEIYDACADTLPDGFSKSKVQYGLLNYWKDEVVKVEGQPNQYRKA